MTDFGAFTAALHPTVKGSVFDSHGLLLARKAS
jgi:hypothetical protein